MMMKRTSSKAKRRPPENRRGIGGLVEAGRSTRFKPGQSPNPGGRPKLKVVSDAIRKQLEDPYPGDSRGRTYAEVIANALLSKAAKGDVRAMQEVSDRAEGKSRQALEFSANESLASPILNITFVDPDKSRDGR